MILDCYNANPTSMQSALESFAMNDASNKLCILGDMKELGEESISEHQKIISLLEKLNLRAYIVGNEFSQIHSQYILKKYDSVEKLISFIGQSPIKNKLILLKGSNSIHLDRLENLL